MDIADQMTNKEEWPTNIFMIEIHGGVAQFGDPVPDKHYLGPMTAQYIHHSLPNTSHKNGVLATSFCIGETIRFKQVIIIYFLLKHL